MIRDIISGLALAAALSSGAHAQQDAPADRVQPPQQQASPATAAVVGTSPSAHIRGVAGAAIVQGIVGNAEVARVSAPIRMAQPQKMRGDSARSNSD